MSRKHFPSTTPATKQLDLDGWSPKTPPLERAVGHVDYPVRLEPFGHVVMASDGHEAAADLALAHTLGHRRGADLRHVAVDHAGELVEDHNLAVARGSQCPGKVAAKPFTAGKNVIWLDPTRRRAESHGCKQPGDLLDGSLAEPVDNRPIPRPVAFPVYPISKHFSCNRALAAARGTDDQADSPIVTQLGHFQAKVFRSAAGQRHVEHAGDLLHAKRIEHRATYRNINRRHRLLRRLRVIPKLTTSAGDTSGPRP